MRNLVKIRNLHNPTEAVHFLSAECQIFVKAGAGRFMVLILIKNIPVVAGFDKSPKKL